MTESAMRLQEAPALGYGAQAGCPDNAHHATLLNEFDRLAEAPGSIPRLRSFILELAVRGKLVPKNAKPHCELEWERFCEWEPSVGCGGDAEASIPFETAKHWRWARMDRVADCRAGRKVDASVIPHEAWLLDMEDIDGGSGKVVTYVKSAERMARSTKAAFVSGDVLYGKLRPYLNKVVVAEGDGFCTTEIVPIRPRPFVLAGYLRIFLRSPYFLGYAEHRNYGMKMPRLGTKDLEGAYVAIPPPEEQHRIVAKVEELMSLCDRLEAAQAMREQIRDRLTVATHTRLSLAHCFREQSSFAVRTIPQLSVTTNQIAQLRRSILNMGVRGFLIRQDSRDEPALILLRRVAQEIEDYREKHRLSKLETAVPVVDDERVLPAGWEWVRLSSLFRVITDGDHQPPPKAAAGIAFLTIGNITTGKIDFSNCRYVPPTYYEALAEYRKPEVGDILYTIVGATFGRPAIVDRHRPFCVQRHIAILKPSAEINRRFLNYLLSSPLVFEQASASAIGTAQPTIALKPLRNFTVPLPPLTQQHRIVAKLDELMAICDRLEAQLSITEAESRRLLEATLQQVLSPGQSE